MTGDDLVRCPTESWEGRSYPHAECLSHRPHPALKKGRRGQTWPSGQRSLTSSTMSDIPHREESAAGTEAPCMEPCGPLLRPRLDASLIEANSEDWVQPLP